MGYGRVLDEILQNIPKKEVSSTLLILQWLEMSSYCYRGVRFYPTLEHFS
jgi:hypothetical protein